MPQTIDLSPEHQRLLLLLESTLHFLVRMPMTKEQAIDLKSRVTLPIGVLNTRFDLRGEQRAPVVSRNGKH